MFISQTCQPVTVSLGSSNRGENLMNFISSGLRLLLISFRNRKCCYFLFQSRWLLFSCSRIKEIRSKWGKIFLMVILLLLLFCIWFQMTQKLKIKFCRLKSMKSLFGFCFAKLVQDLKSLMLDWILKEKTCTFMHQNDSICAKGNVTGLFSHWTTLCIVGYSRLAWKPWHGSEADLSNYLGYVSSFHL